MPATFLFTLPPSLHFLCICYLEAVQFVKIWLWSSASDGFLKLYILSAKGHRSRGRYRKRWYQRNTRWLWHDRHWGHTFGPKMSTKSPLNISWYKNKVKVQNILCVWFLSFLICSLSMVDLASFWSNDYIASLEHHNLLYGPCVNKF